MLEKTASHQLGCQTNCFCNSLTLDEQQTLFPKFQHFDLERKTILTEDTLNQSPIVLVIKGSIGVQHVLSDGRRTIAAFFVAGDVIDLRGKSRRRQISLCALTQSEICLLDADVFDDVLAKNRTAHNTVFEVLRKQVHRAFDHSVDLGKKQAMEKIASFLCECRNRQSSCKSSSANLALPMQQYDIADYLGLQPETVSRCLRQLKTDGIIKLQKPSQIVILKLPRLKRMASGAQS